MIAGDVRLSDGGIPKRAAIYFENVTGPGSPGKDRASLSMRSTHSQIELLVLPLGTTLSINNDDYLTHSLFSVSPTKPMSLGPMSVGESRSVVLDRPGVVDIFCSMHDVMQATVVIAPSNLVVLSNSQGSFALSGVPVGRYRAVAYAPELGQALLSVDVKNGERSALHFRIAHPAHPPAVASGGPVTAARASAATGAR